MVLLRRIKEMLNFNHIYHVFKLEIRVMKEAMS